MTKDQYEYLNQTYRSILMNLAVDDDGNGERHAAHNAQGAMYWLKSNHLLPARWMEWKQYRVSTETIVCVIGELLRVYTKDHGLCYPHNWSAAVI